MTEVEQQITKRVYEFDILPLLRLLSSIGYRPEEIRFRSHNSICSQPGLIDSIRFRREPVREVVITMNIGLLSAQSPLPSYFRKKLLDGIGSGHSFEGFCGFFDHHLIRDYIGNLFPETNKYLFPSVGRTKRDYLQILDLQSPSALNWLFQLVFPEIRVEVKKACLKQELKTVPLVLGRTAIGGDATFGSKASTPVQGRSITLHSEDELSDTRIPWPREIKSRLSELIFPVLSPTGITLEIDLVLNDQKRCVQLTKETYLGYDRISSDGDSYRRVRIFKGMIGESGQPAGKAPATGAGQMTSLSDSDPDKKRMAYGM